jgi:hypothetical protein
MLKGASGFARVRGRASGCSASTRSTTSSGAPRARSPAARRADTAPICCAARLRGGARGGGGQSAAARRRSAAPRRSRRAARRRGRRGRFRGRAGGAARGVQFRVEFCRGANLRATAASRQLRGHVPSATCTLSQPSAAAPETPTRTTVRPKTAYREVPSTGWRSRFAKSTRRAPPPPPGPPAAAAAAEATAPCCPDPAPAVMRTVRPASAATSSSGPASGPSVGCASRARCVCERASACARPAREVIRRARPERGPPAFGGVGGRERPAPRRWGELRARSRSGGTCRARDKRRGAGVCASTGEFPDSRREALPPRHPAPPARPAAAPAPGARLPPRPAPRTGQPPPRQQRSGRHFRARSGSAHKRNPPTLSLALGGQDLLQLGGLRREAHARLDRGLHARVAPEPRGARARARRPRLGVPRLAAVGLIEVK